MLNFPLTKKLSVIAVLVLALVMALPNVLSQSARDALPDFMPTGTLNLGLDLQGGSHLVLEVDIERVFARAYENLEDEVRVALREGPEARRFMYSSLDATADKVTLVPLNPDDATAITELLEEELQEVNITRDGERFQLRFTPERLEEMGLHALLQTLEILRTRVDEFGVAEPLIQRQGNRRVIIELPGIEDAARAKAIIGRTAQLTFHMVHPSKDAANFIGRTPPAGYTVLYENAVNLDGETYRIPYLVKKRPEISGENLSGASTGFDQQGEPAVFVEFDAAGTRKFGKITTEYTGHRMAIVLDNEVYSAPVLREPILGGSASITGNFNPAEAEDLATVLRAGALPAPVNVVEERTVGPSLGADSVTAGTMAIIVGFIAVMLAMLVFYRGFGMAANVALLFNVVLIVAVMTMLGATLTLPGMAGIVLTIGMAVDANVLIFERIREEARLGKSPMLAMDSGFRSAFGTILDANITTFIAAVVLFAVGSGPVKGFALTLTVGIAASMFTAIMVTRMMLVTWAHRTRPKRLAL